MNRIDTMVKNPDFRNMFTMSKIAEKSICNVKVIKGNSVMDAKSIMGILTLGLREGDLVAFESEDIETIKALERMV